MMAMVLAQYVLLTLFWGVRFASIPRDFGLEETKRQKRRRLVWERAMITFIDPRVWGWISAGMLWLLGHALFVLSKGVGEVEWYVDVIVMFTMVIDTTALLSFMMIILSGLGRVCVALWAAIVRLDAMVCEEMARLEREEEALVTMAGEEVPETALSRVDQPRLTEQAERGLSLVHDDEKEVSA